MKSYNEPRVLRLWYKLEWKDSSGIALYYLSMSVRCFNFLLVVMYGMLHNYFIQLELSVISRSTDNTNF